MSYIIVNGYEFPPPKRGVSVTVSTAVNSGRNANGVVVGQKVGRDLYKIDNLEWPYLPAKTWERILGCFKHFFVNVTFQDPVTGKPKTIKMYPGDRNGKPYWIDGNGKPLYYTDCKVNLIDTGA